MLNGFRTWSTAASLSIRAFTDDVSTAAKEGFVVAAVTLHFKSVYSCPPLPYDAVASIERSLHRPTEAGALNIIVGGVGFSAAVVVITL
jgi:hypothetical protein